MAHNRFMKHKKEPSDQSEGSLLCLLGILKKFEKGKKHQKIFT